MSKFLIQRKKTQKAWKQTLKFLSSIQKSSAKKHNSAPKTTRSFSNILNSLSARSLSVKDQTFFAKRLSFLIRSGVPILESLVMIREQTHSKKQGAIIDEIIVNVSNGQYLSTSLEKSKKLFGTFAINIIRIGETTGILSENLDYLAEELKKKQALRRKVIGAFVYPVVVSIATLGITIFLVVYLFPKIMPVFLSLHVKLPLSTRIVIWLSDFLRSYGFGVLGLLFLGSISFTIILNKVYSVRFFIQRQILRIPIIGTILQYYNLANVNRTLGLLLRSGVTIAESLSITADTTPSLVYREEYMTMVQTINRGEKISSHLKTNLSLFPEVMSQIIAVGERSGDLQNSLMYLAQFYENEVDDFTKNLSNLVEPVLMILMGVLVGFIAISIITPIYGITQNLHV